MLSNRNPQERHQRRHTSVTSPTQVVIRVALCGEIDLANSSDIVTQLGMVATEHRQVVVDLTRVTYIDASGIRACLKAQELARTRGCQLQFTNPQGIVAQVIEILGLENAMLGGSRASE